MRERLLSQARNYQLRAEEVRSAADETPERLCQDALRRIADGYERLARALEQVAKRDIKLADIRATPRIVDGSK